MISCKNVVFLVVLGLTLGAASVNAASFSSVCASVKALPKTVVYKTIGSRHITADCRSNLPNVIGVFGAPNLAGGVDLVDKNGNIVTKMGNYGTWRGGPWRLYSCIGRGGSFMLSAAKVAAKARSKTGDKKVYIRGVSGSQRNVCYGPIDPTQCYNTKNC